MEAGRRWSVWVAAMVVALIVVAGPGCTNDRKQLNEHQRVLDSEKD